MSRGVEMGSHCFLDLLVANVTAVSIEADRERVLCLSHVLQFAFPALDEVDDVPRLAGLMILQTFLCSNCKQVVKQLHLYGSVSDSFVV